MILKVYVFLFQQKPLFLLICLSALLRIIIKMSFFTLEFSVSCFTQIGQVVYICGNTAELGNWNPQNALRLFTDRSIYPKWSPYKSITARQSQKIVFKLCIMKEGNLSRWENIPGNRQIIPEYHLSVQFTADEIEMNIMPVHDIVAKGPKKKTLDILNELESDGSSSKQYWKQFMEDQEESQLYITVLNQMRKLIESNSSLLGLDEQGLEIPKILSHEQQKPADPNKQNIHDGKIQSHRPEKHIKNSHMYLIIQNHQQQNRLQSNSALRQGLYVATFNELDKYVIHNNKVPIFFHIQQQESNRQQVFPQKSFVKVLEDLQKIILSEMKLLQQGLSTFQYYISLKVQSPLTKSTVQAMVKARVSMISFTNQISLNSFLQDIRQLHLSYYIKEKFLILVRLTNSGILMVKLLNDEKDKVSFNQLINTSSQLRDNYIESIKNDIFDFYTLNCLNSSSKSFNEKIKNEEIFSMIKVCKKIIIVIYIQNFKDLHEKILREITQLSARPHFQIYVICEDVLEKVEDKLYQQNKNKMVVLSLKGGNIFTNRQSYIDIFHNMCQQKNKFYEIIKDIKNSVSFGVKSIQQEIAQLRVQFLFQPNLVGQLGREQLKKNIKAHNKVSLFKIFWKQHKNQTVSVFPFCVSQQFYLKSIFQSLANILQGQKCLVLEINFKQKQNIFLEKSRKILSRISSKNLVIFIIIFVQKIQCKCFQIFQTKSIEMDGKAKVTLNEKYTLKTGIFEQEVISADQIFQILKYINELLLLGSTIKQTGNHVVTPKGNPISSKSFTNQYSSAHWDSPNLYK